MRALKYIGVGLLGVVVITAVGMGIAILLGIPLLASPICFLLGVPWGVYWASSYMDGKP